MGQLPPAPPGLALPCWTAPPLPPSNLAPVRTPSPTPAPGPPTSGAWQSLTGSGPPHPGSRHHHHSLTALTSVPLPPLAGAGEDTSAPQALASSRSHVLLTTKSGQASQAGVLALPSPLPRSGDAANPLASHPTAGQPGKLLAAQLTALGAASARLKQPGDRAPASASSEAAESHGGVSTDGSCLYPPLACLAAADSLLGAGLHSHFHWHLLAVVDIARQIAEGLEYLQSRGVVHGDLKLQNCLACSDPSSPLGFSVKICDFGLSRILQGNKTHTTVTQPPGTLAYLAPELLTTCYMSPSCDLYGLGILLWELLVMRQPFSNLTVAQILFAKATGTIDEYLPFPALAPHSYVLLAKQCWSTAPSARPSLREVMQRLQAVSAETGLQHCARCSSQPRYPALPP
ncbi:kinase-like domain-containing protein [Haematococcus lacustris]